MFFFYFFTIFTPLLPGMPLNSLPRPPSATVVQCLSSARAPPPPVGRLHCQALRQIIAVLLGPIGDPLEQRSSLSVLMKVRDLKSCLLSFTVWLDFFIFFILLLLLLFFFFAANWLYYQFLSGTWGLNNVLVFYQSLQFKLNFNGWYL